MSDYGYGVRTRALLMDETTLRRRVDLLLEQAAREASHPPLTERGGMLHAEEIFWLLGVGPRPGMDALNELAQRIQEESGS